MFVTISGITINTAAIQCYYARGRESITKYGGCNEPIKTELKGRLVIEFIGKDNFIEFRCKDQKELDVYRDLLDQVTHPIEA